MSRSSEPQEHTDTLTHACPSRSAELQFRLKLLDRDHRRLAKDAEELGRYPLCSLFTLVATPADTRCKTSLRIQRRCDHRNMMGDGKTTLENGCAL
ncbi:hypothetical protein O3P69_003135 [Scylla paramamosain]|uniref:Uncharacterized protein n=1 Tax=Scylla paramamosain TaxID=85552 RepID=A0AAW0UJ96_SCYPA